MTLQGHLISTSVPWWPVCHQSELHTPIFRHSIGKVPLGQTVNIDIEYIMELKHDSEVHSLRFTIELWKTTHWTQFTWCMHAEHQYISRDRHVEQRHIWLCTFPSNNPKTTFELNQWLDSSTPLTTHPHHEIHPPLHSKRSPRNAPHAIHLPNPHGHTLSQISSPGMFHPPKSSSLPIVQVARPIVLRRSDHLWACSSVPSISPSTSTSVHLAHNIPLGRSSRGHPWTTRIRRETDCPWRRGGEFGYR